MNKFYIGLIASSSLAALHAPALADTGDDRRTAWEASRSSDDSGMIATGVAKARDRLDSATSTSSLMGNDISKLSANSLSDLLRNIPGIRAEAATGEGNNANYSIRGLPLVSSGAKYLQFQEDGLPVLEFGDILGITPDIFIRPDFNIAQIESIRGGSASTFASNAPGGVINLISKAGEVQGGSVQVTAGLSFESYRTDFDYGGQISDDLFVHIGGFYRQGQSPRRLNYTADRGGQLKLNVTRKFSGGYIRLYGKYLNDTNALFTSTPMSVSGTNANPRFGDVGGFSASHDSLLSSNISKIPVIDGDNALTQFDMRDGQKVIAAAVGLEARFDIGDWNVSERMRYADQSGDSASLFPFAFVPAIVAAPAFGAPGGMLSYATGPARGMGVGNPLALNGNGLLAYSGAIYTKIRSVNNFMNDFRVSRVWPVGGGDLTGTAGIYLSHQDINFDRAFVGILQDVSSATALVNITRSNGLSRTQDGILDFFGPTAGTHSSVDVGYRVAAPYGSLNFHRGKVSVGASIRVDDGTVKGAMRTNRPADVLTIDVDKNGIISDAERTFAFAPFANNVPVNYSFNYFSYSGSVNYRPSDSFSTFIRFSRGARAGADRILFSPAISSVDGSLQRREAAYDPVQQGEVGVKFRGKGVFVAVTGFWAKVSETNTQLRPGANGTTTLALVNRSYRAIGGELEAGFRMGPIRVTGSATVTDAKITAADDVALVGHRPRHQAPVIFQVLSQYEAADFSLGVNLVGTGSSFSQDENVLKLPAFATVGAFLEVRPYDRVVISVNASNIFNTRAITDVSSASIPASGVVVGQSLVGRTVSSAVRFYF